VNRTKIRFNVASLAQWRLRVLNEIGHLPMNPESAHLFFRVVSDRYETALTFLTSNKM